MAQWTADDVQNILMDPRTMGIGGFPRVVDDQRWIAANVKQISEMGPKRYLTKFLEVLRESFISAGEFSQHIGAIFEDSESVVMDPRNIGVGMHPSLQRVVTDEAWIEDNVNQIGDMGAQGFLRTMVDILRYEYGAEQEPQRKKPVSISTLKAANKKRAREGARDDNRLGLYSHILPVLARMKKRGALLAAGINEGHLADGKIDEFTSAEVFDCRGLPLEFVADSGDAAWEELQATREPLKLPFESCYFEFDREIAIYARSYQESVDPGSAVSFEVFRNWSNDLFEPNVSDPQTGEFYYDFTVESYNEWQTQFGGETPKTVTEVPFFEVVNEIDEGRDMPAAGRLLLGVLALMQDKLLISNEFKANPRPWLTQARRERGQPPKEGDVRVLTMNVPAIRNATKRAAPIGTHESPALHWRRGHWRNLPRADEARTWVRKCLVGDPERGFVTKNYRLVATMSPLVTIRPTIVGGGEP